jgi:hypothetical protein
VVSPQFYQQAQESGDRRDRPSSRVIGKRYRMFHSHRAGVDSNKFWQFRRLWQLWQFGVRARLRRHFPVEDGLEKGGIKE